MPSGVTNEEAVIKIEEDVCKKLGPVFKFFLHLFKHTFETHHE